MKKTIAKLMAAAMLLSAVPAVTMPSFVSKADSAAVTNTATGTYASYFKTGGDLTAETKSGEVFSFIIDKDALGLSKAVTDLVKPVAIATGSSDTAFVSLVNLTVTQDAGNSKLYHVKAALPANMTASQKTTFMSAVKNAKNNFKVRIDYVSSAADAAAKQEADYLKLLPQFANVEMKTSEKVYWLGGQYVNGKIKTGIRDEDLLLQDGNVYATVDKTLSDGVAEVQLLKQDTSEGNKLDKNDNLRGKKLNLDTVWIGGVNYKVGKLGAQALKKAKMKKVQLKNCSKVGKGALRECKQLKNVNLKDKNKVRKIHAKAFYKCKNLRNITIDARKLNVVGKDAVAKVKKNCKIKLKASKSKYNDCVKKFKKSGAKDVKYSRLAP